MKIYLAFSSNTAKTHVDFRFTIKCVFCFFRWVKKNISLSKKICSCHDDVKHCELLCIYFTASFTQICNTTGARTEYFVQNSFVSILKSIRSKFFSPFFLFDEPQNEVFIVFPSITRLRFFPHRRVRVKKWIKNCCIHMKIFLLCKHFTYVSVTTRNFF